MLDTESEVTELRRSLDRGYKSCHGATKRFFKGMLWPLSNIPRDERQAVDTLLFNLMRTIDLLDLESIDGLSLDVWHETRDELSDAFRGRYHSNELAALADTARRFDIPRQFIFDPIRGADLWIRNRKFETFDELESFCSYVGGSAMASVVPVLGFVRPGYEIPAIECGKGVMLTLMLANLAKDMKQNKIFIATEDFKNCEVDLPRLKLRRTSKEFRHLVRVYCARIEQMLHKGGELVPHLDFDAKRSVKSMLSLVCKLLLKMKIEPECILSDEGVLSGRELLILKSRHLMGMEPSLPFLPQETGHGH